MIITEKKQIIAKSGGLLNNGMGGFGSDAADKAAISKQYQSFIHALTHIFHEKMGCSSKEHEESKLKLDVQIGPLFRNVQNLQKKKEILNGLQEVIDKYKSIKGFKESFEVLLAHNNWSDDNFINALKNFSIKPEPLPPPQKKQNKVDNAQKPVEREESKPHTENKIKKLFVPITGGLSVIGTLLFLFWNKLFNSSPSPEQKPKSDLKIDLNQILKNPIKKNN